MFYDKSVNSLGVFRLFWHFLPIQFSDTSYTAKFTYHIASCSVILERNVV